MRKPRKFLVLSFAAYMKQRNLKVKNLFIKTCLGIAQEISCYLVGLVVPKCDIDRSYYKTNN